MRFLGFLTGTALLVVLYVVMTNPQVFPVGQNKLANNIRNMLNNGVEKVSKPTEKTTDVQKRTAHDPIPKKTLKPKTSPAPVKKRNINPSRKSARPLPAKDKIIVLKSNPSTRPAESAMSATALEKPKQINPSPQVVTVEKNTATIKASINNASAEHQVRLQSFWGPFKTRISARGFANNLAKRTAVKLEIVETRPGAFMVAYPYVSENQRQAIATLIEQRTGLRLSDH